MVGCLKTPIWSKTPLKNQAECWTADPTISLKNKSGEQPLWLHVSFWAQFFCIGSECCNILLLVTVSGSFLASRPSRARVSAIAKLILSKPRHHLPSADLRNNHLNIAQQSQLTIWKLNYHSGCSFRKSNMYVLHLCLIQIRCFPDFSPQRRSRLHLHPAEGGQHSDRHERWQLRSC